MTTLREAAEMALEALNRLKTKESVDTEIAVLRAALAPAPVAWMDRKGDIYPMPEIEGWAPPHTMLYTHPLQSKPLSDEEIDAIELPPSGTATVRDLVRAIERAHGIGSEE